MRGRQVFLDSLKLHNATHIFGNPGTTENPLLEGLIEYPELTYIVALHEGVAVGAANSFAQASNRTAVANVHVAPGLGNAIGMMYGALKASLPVIVTAGQQDTRLRLREPLLRHELIDMAKPVTKWAAEPQNADEISPIMRRAFQIANEHPRGPVFIALPNNVMEQETEIAALTSGILHTDSTANPAALHAMAEAIVESTKFAVLAGDDVAQDNATQALAEFAQATGAAVYTDFIPARMPIAATHPNFCGHVPHEAARLKQLLSDYDLVLTIGGMTLEEIWYDDTPAISSYTQFMQLEAYATGLARTQQVRMGVAGHLARSLGTLKSQCASIAEESSTGFSQAVEARNQYMLESRRCRDKAATDRLHKQSGQTPITPLEAMHSLAEALPADIVIVDEAITASADLEQAFQLTEPEQFFAGRGGGIGQGLAGGLGTAVALPERKVCVVSGDGSAMYSIQALWTAAHHQLNILFVILANAEYRVLKHNVDAHRARFDAASDQPYPHMDLTQPGLSFTQLASGMGVTASTATTPSEIEQAVVAAKAGEGPYLLEILVQGKARDHS